MTDKQFPRRQENAVSPNGGALSLQVANALALPAEWTNRFTLVHQRLLTFALTTSEWTRCLSELHRVIKPGGFVELVETAHQLHKYPAGTPGDRFAQNVFQLTKYLDLSMELPMTLEKMHVEAGFVDIRIVEIDIPLNEDRGNGAKEASCNFHNALNAFHEAFVKTGLMSVDAAEHTALVDEVREQWNKDDVHHKFLAWSARKL